MRTCTTYSSAISLAFLTRLDTQDRVDWLTPTRLGRWLASVGYSGRTHPATLHARLTDAPRGLTGPDALVEAGSTHALIAVLTTLTEQIKKLETQISDQLAAHADAHIFTSLPRSGRVRAVSFRWACDKQLRDAVTDFAGDSHHANPWAADLYDRARARGHDHPHAVRIPARAWLYVIWHLWQGHTAYDPTKHHALQRLLTNPTQEAPAAAG